MKVVLLCCLMLLFPALALPQSSSPGQWNSGAEPRLLEIGIDAASQTPAPAEQLAGAPGAQQGPGAATTPQLSASTGTNFSQVISFDEYATGTMITNQFMDRGLIFGGSGPVISPDAASATSPVLTGSPPFEGDITGQFVVPGTTEPAPVYLFTWDIGFFDAVGTVQMDFFGPDGQLVYSTSNSLTGFLRYRLKGGSAGIASWRFHIISTEPAGFGIDNLYYSIPGQGDLDREKGEIACARGNPVNPAVGNKYQRETDYRGARSFPLLADRAYNSIDGDWQFFAEIRYRSSDVAAQVIRPDGKGLTYTRSTATAWRATSNDMTGTLATTVDSAGNITGWQYTTLDDQVERYDATGRLLSVSLRSGVSHDYTYTADEITVTHSFGGSLTYVLDELGRPAGFTDPGGNTYGYDYDASGRLAGVSYPNGGGSRVYHYEDSNFSDLLTGISDANGDRFATWTYDGKRRATVSEHDNGAGRTLFDYTFVDHPDFPQTRVTNPLGKDTSYHYFTVNGARKVFHVSGHESPNCVAANQDYGFDANAFIASKTDWKGNVTSYLRDSRGRELSRTEAQGTPVQRTVTTQWHPTFNLPLRITEPGRDTTFTYDANGNLLGRSMVDLTVP